MDLSPIIESQTFEIDDLNTFHSQIGRVKNRLGLEVEQTSDVVPDVFTLSADLPLTKTQWQNFANWLAPLLAKESFVSAIQVIPGHPSLSSSVLIQKDGSLTLRAIYPKPNQMGI